MGDGAIVQWNVIHVMYYGLCSDHRVQNFCRLCSDPRVPNFCGLCSDHKVQNFCSLCSNPRCRISAACALIPGLCSDGYMVIFKFHKGMICMHKSFMANFFRIAFVAQ